MSAPVVTALPDETVAAAAQRMRERKVGSVVVTDGGTKAVGILTERDVLRLASEGGDPTATAVSECMTANPDTVAPGVDAPTAFASLAEHGYRHIPVVANGALVGIVSIRDLMRVVVDDESPRGV